MVGLAIGLASPGLSNAQTGDSDNAGAVFVMTNAAPILQPSAGILSPNSQPRTCLVAVTQLWLTSQNTLE